MENGTQMFGGFDWGGIIGLLIIAGIFGYGNGFGFNNNARTDITNEFMYNQLANNLSANNVAVNTTDRDVLENRYQNSIQTQTLSNQMSTNALQMQSSQAQCCCDIKNAIATDGALTRALIQENTIQDLRDRIADKDREALATGLSYSTALSVRNAKEDILNSIGNYYPKTGVNPYYVYGYNYGTTIQ